MRVLVVSCQPCEESYIAHVAARSVAALSARHEVRHTDLYGTYDETDIAWAEALVLVYPTWWASMPAALVEYLDGILSAQPRYPELRLIVAVSSHGSKKWVNVVEGEVGRRIVLRGLRRHGNVDCKARWIAVYNIDRSTHKRRERFVRKVERKLARLS